jgi:trans-2,3-dihydro-3-hydroxyanthranilate isomerase
MPRQRREYEFVQVDVFAEQPLAGNALVILVNARGLSDDEMQSIARETNLSETAFILPRSPEVERKQGIQVRIFTPHEELVFAGHPTLGTASWLYLKHPTLRGSQEITLELRIGPIKVYFAEQQGLGVFATMRQNDPTFGEFHSPTVVASVLGLALDDLDLSLPIQTISTGMAFCIVPLRSLDAAARLAIASSAAEKYLAGSDAKFFYCMTRAEASSGADWHSRMLFYNGEDPATGSASGCAISYLVRQGLAASDQPIIIEQGIEMLRPSRIYVQASSVPPDSVTASTNPTGVVEASIQNVRVGGRTILIASGRIIL